MCASVLNSVFWCRRFDCFPLIIFGLFLVLIFFSLQGTASPRARLALLTVRCRLCTTMVLLSLWVRLCVDVCALGEARQACLPLHSRAPLARNRHRSYSTPPPPRPTPVFRHLPFSAVASVAVAAEERQSSHAQAVEPLPTYTDTGRLEYDPPFFRALRLHDQVGWLDSLVFDA